MIRRELTLFLVAVQFLTRVPVPSFGSFETEWLDRAAKYFPLVGAAVGGISALALWGASQVWPASLAALIAVAAGIVATGCFHEDGLADTADGLGGGLTVARRLEIMKDSRIGTYGAVALMLVLALKIMSIAALEVPSAIGALIAAHASARLATVVAIQALPYAGDADAAKVKPLATGITGHEMVIAAVFGLAPIFMIDPACFAIGLAGGAMPALLLAYQSRRLIGGYTGDVLGAIEQVFEVGFLLAVVAAGQHSH